MTKYWFAPLSARTIVSAAVVALTLLPSASQAGEQLTHHGTFQDWQIFRLDSQNLMVCYAATEAIQYHPKTTPRTRPVAYIVRYPKTTSTNTLEIRFGGRVSQFQSMTAKVIARRRPARDTFPLAIKRDAGFMTTADDQELLITAMKKGRQLMILSQPGVGDILEDRYSLFGYSAALAKLEELCPGPEPKTPVTPERTAKDVNVRGNTPPAPAKPEIEVTP